MALKVWLPLSGDTTTNYGLSDASGVAVSATEPITPAYGNSILGDKALAVGTNGVAVKASLKMDLTKFTVSFWVKDDGTNSAEDVLFTIQNGNTDLVTCVKGTEGYVIPQLHATETLFDLTSAWTHVAVTADGTKVKVYVNGSLNKEVNQANSIVVENNATITITFGGKFVSDNIVQSWSGSVCDLKLYDSVISLFEAVALSNGLVLHYAFNGNVSFGTGISNEDYPTGTDAEFYGFAGNTEYDLSGNEFDGTFGTKKPVTASDTPMYSSSYNFTSADPITVSINSSEFRTRYTVSIWAKGTGNAVSFSNGTTLAVSDSDAWHNIVVTSDAKKYVDGVESESIVSGLIGNGTCNITIGGESYSGKLSDFRIYAKKMSADEIAALYKRKAAIDNSGKLIATEIVVEDGASASFSKTGVVTAAAMNNWTGESDSPVDVSTFSILQTSGAINASDVIEF